MNKKTSFLLGWRMMMRMMMRDEEDDDEDEDEMMITQGHPRIRTP